METFVHLIEQSKNDLLRVYLNEHGFELSRPPHTLFSGKKPGLSVTLFESQKCVIQGKQSAEFIEFFFEPEILGSFPLTHQICLPILLPTSASMSREKGIFSAPLSSQASMPTKRDSSNCKGSALKIRRR